MLNKKEQRLRRAREALLQAGTAPEVIEQIGLEPVPVDLGQRWHLERANKVALC